MNVSNKSNWSRLRLAAAFAASMLPSALFFETPAQAQLFFSRLPPAQVVAIVRSQGYQNPSYPYFRGDIYVVDAFDPRGVRVRLVIDPRSGDIVERLFIRNQRVIAVPEEEQRFDRSLRILNPSEEAAESERREARPRRSARRPVERQERAPEIAAPVEQQPVERPAAAEQAPPPAAPEPKRQRSRAPSSVQEPVAREAPAANPAPQEKAQSSAPAVSNAGGPAAPSAPGDPGPSGPASSASGERGTKANPRRVGPVVLPPAVGVE